MVDRRAQNNHGTTAGLICIGGKFAGHLNNIFPWHPGNGFLPCGGIGHVIVVTGGNIFAAMAVINAVVGDHQVVNGCNQDLAIFGFQALDRHIAVKDAFVVCRLEGKDTLAISSASSLMLIKGQISQIGRASCRERV